ncbi:hypothetical protein P3S68_033259 [Capsicum galapagoense]
MIELQKKEKDDAKMKKKYEEHNKDKSRKDQGTPEDTMLSSNIIDLTIKVTQNERPEEKNEGKKQREQEDSLEEDMSQNHHPQQQQNQHEKNDVAELNKVSCEYIFSNNFDRILYDSYANYGSKLWIGNKKDGHYQIRRGIPRSIKFRSITNLYKCTRRISPVEDEYKWNPSTEKDSNMNISTKEDSNMITNKENIGCKRKRRENQNANGEKVATTFSTQL